MEQDLSRATARTTRSTAGTFKTACSTDLLFLLDSTFSMKPHIEAAKAQIKDIVRDTHEAFLRESHIRVAVVAYTDHGNDPSIRFLDFTPDVQQVHDFLDGIKTEWGQDFPENVLGGLHQAIAASWQQQTRCLVHIADAPPHGSILHDLSADSDNYSKPGSEPHGLTHEPLIKELIQLDVNYALLSIHNWTDRMALAFSTMYSETGQVHLLPSNTYFNEMKETKSSFASQGVAMMGPRFMEEKLGVSYSKLRHLVVKSITSSLSASATRLTCADAKTAPPDRQTANSIFKSSLSRASMVKESGPELGIKVSLERPTPLWSKPSWFDEMLELEGFCPDVVVHNAATLNDMIHSDDNIKLSVAQLTLRARSKPFALGALRAATYARPVNTINQFVVKSFIKQDGDEFVSMVEDMRIQALCKSFALEFNSLVRGRPIDFVVTMCLQEKKKKRKAMDDSRQQSFSLEPFIEGEYIKYNNNASMVMEEPHPFNDTAQAFSHFTFERSWGLFMVVDLQGVGNLLTDPAVHTKDKNRFKLCKTNLNEDGFKLFFVSHKCNEICKTLGLKSNREMAAAGRFEFREEWPTMDQTVCCSNKLCRRIIRLANAHQSVKYAGQHHWCDTCWPQLESTTFQSICVGPGQHHEYEVSRFFYESQAQEAPKKCPDHLEKDTTELSAAAIGGSLWNKMKDTGEATTILGRAW